MTGATTTVGGVDADAPADELPSVRRRPVVVGVALGALALPFAVIVVIALTRAWYPASDTALIELRALDVGTGGTPMVGPFSRLGWNHPGPLLFWVLAVPLRLVGGADRGLLLGAALVNAAAVVGSLHLAARRGGRTLLVLTALAIALLIHGFGAGFLVRAWNPDLPVLPTVFLVLAVWSVIDGEVRWLPAVVVVAAFGWQSHLGYLPITGALVVAALAGVLWRWRVDGRDHVRNRVVAIVSAVGVGLVVLAPIVIDQVVRRPGNVRLVLGSFRDPTATPAGWARALRIAASHLVPWGAWSTGTEPVEVFSGVAAGSAPALLLIPAAVGAGVGVAAWRTGIRTPVRLMALAGVVAVVGIVAVSRTTGAAYPYLFNWFRPIASAFWLGTAWAAVGLVRHRAGARVDRWAAPALVIASVLVVVASTASLVVDDALELPDPDQSDALAEIVPPVLAAVAGRPRVDLGIEGLCGREVGDGVGLQLVKAGTEVIVVDDLATGFGPHRAASEAGTAPTAVRVVCGEGTRPAIDAAPAPPVATHEVFSPEDWRAVTRLRDGFRRELLDAGRPDLLPAVDDQYLKLVEAEEAAGIRFDPVAKQRYGQMLGTQVMAVAVFVDPAP